MSLFVMTYTKVFSKPFDADNLEAAALKAKADVAQDIGQRLLAVRSGTEYQAARSRGEVG